MKMNSSQESSLFRDDMTGDWIIIAGARKAKPTGFGGKAQDPFSPAAMRATERILATYGKGSNSVYAVRNHYPIFGKELGIGGAQELLVEGAIRRPFWTSTEAQIVTLLEAFAARFEILRKNPTIKYIGGFKNDGRDAGASQPHPHSHIFAVPFVPERMKQIVKLRGSALKRLGMTSHEYALHLATKELTIFRDANVIAYANPTARYAYEVRIVPVRRFDSIEDAVPEERQSFAKAFLSLFPLLKQRKFAYNFFFHDIVGDRMESFEIRFIPRVEIAGGFEFDAGVYVNPVMPEVAATEYRKARK